MRKYFEDVMREMLVPTNTDMSIEEYAFDQLPYIQYVLEHRTCLMLVPRRTGKTFFLQQMAKRLPNTYVVTHNQFITNGYKRQGVDNVVSVCRCSDMNQYRGIKNHPFLTASGLFFDESVRSRDDAEKFLTMYLNMRNVSAYGAKKERGFFLYGLYT